MHRESFDCRHGAVCCAVCSSAHGAEAGSTRRSNWVVSRLGFLLTSLLGRGALQLVDAGFARGVDVRIGDGRHHCAERAEAYRRHTIVLPIQFRVMPMYTK
eukprot:COSAG04_NODE_2570_length_3912_cov_1.439549_3_plen_101_part_00